MKTLKLELILVDLVAKIALIIGAVVIGKNVVNSSWLFGSLALFFGIVLELALSKRR